MRRPLSLRARLILGVIVLSAAGLLVADVATYKVFSGTHTGTFLGIEPTGRRLEFPVFDLIRFRDRMLVEHWAVIDEGAMLRTLGLID